MFHRILFLVKYNARIQWLIACLLLVIVLFQQLTAPTSPLLGDSGKSISVVGSDGLTIEGMGSSSGGGGGSSFRNRLMGLGSKGDKNKGAVPRKTRGYVYNDALTLSITTEPYIYPDLTKLEEYRTRRAIQLPDGTKVISKTHATLYKPMSKRRSRFGVLVDGLKTLIVGSGGRQKPFIKSSSKMNPRIAHLLATQNSDEFERTLTDPPIVMVLGLDADRYPKHYLDLIVKDRLAYARKHGYGLYVRYLQDFVSEDEKDTTDKISPLEFTKVGVMREAMFSFSTSAWFWWLDQDALITNHDWDIGADLVYNKDELSNRMLRDKPIIPPESIIHTYKRIPAEQIKLITMQNDLGVNLASFIVRQDQLYGRVLMDYLKDPLQRKYQGFRDVGSGKALNAAMTHLLQWHPAILSRMALVSPAILGAYPEDNTILKGSQYKPGDFVYLLKSSLVAHRGVLDVDFIMDEWSIMRQSVAGPVVAPAPMKSNKKGV